MENKDLRLAKEYKSLYDTDFYKSEVEYLKKNNPDALKDFEENVRLADKIYQEAKKNIVYTSNTKDSLVGFKKANKEIVDIVKNNPYAVEILRDAEGVEKGLDKSGKLSYLNMAVKFGVDARKTAEAETKKEKEDKEVLSNKYESLYDTDFYKSQVKFLKENKPESLEKFEENMKLANKIYLEAKNNIIYTSNDKNSLIGIKNPSKEVVDIVKNNPYIVEILRDAEGVEKGLNKSTKTSYLNMAVKHASNAKNISNEKGNNKKEL